MVLVLCPFAEAVFAVLLFEIIDVEGAGFDLLVFLFSDSLGFVSDLEENNRLVVAAILPLIGLVEIVE